MGGGGSMAKNKPINNALYPHLREHNTQSHPFTLLMNILI